MHKTSLISFLISGVEAWPHCKSTLDSISGDAFEKYGEIIIVSNHPEVFPEVQGIYQGNNSSPQVFIYPHEDIFSLRRLGLAHCTGEWIVLLEDHNIVPTAWIDFLTQIINSNQSDQVLVTALKNGSETTRIDQANFLFNFGAYLPAVSHMSFDRIPVIAGACFHRSIIHDLAGLKDGELELIYLPALYRNGKTRYISQFSINHVQSNTRISTCQMHYFNARACAGLLKQLNGNRIDWKMFWLHLHSPIYFFKKWTFSPYKKILELGYGHCWFYLILLGIIYGYGSVIGWLFGKGQSAMKLA